MKKLFLSITVVFLMILSSCVSFSSGFTNTPVYNANISSSALSEGVFKKDGGVLVYCEMGDYLFQRKLETSLVTALNEKGINAIPYSDFEITGSPSSLQDLYQCGFDNNCRYVYFFIIEEQKTYPTDRGISMIKVDSLIVDLELFIPTYRLGGYYDCQKNVFHSLGESYGPITECIVNSIVPEFSNIFI